MRAYHPEKDYYAVLGVPSSANAHEIRSAFRKLALLHHPDRNNGTAEAAQRFVYVSQAYEVLGDPHAKHV